LLILFTACADESETVSPPEEVNYAAIPPHFPPIPFPASNPYSAAKFELGRKLFYDRSMSEDYTIASCSHCMKQQYNFSDNTPTSLGHNRNSMVRNVMNLTNSAYRRKKFWDGRGSCIESPAYRSFFLTSVFASDTNEINNRLQNNVEYKVLFKKAFGKDAVPSVWLAVKSIATFVRCFVSGNSAYDKFLNGNIAALSESVHRGIKLFFSDRLNCSKCHSGLFFTDGKYHNTGVTTHYFDFGLYYLTKKNSDKGKFLTPSLRNCEVSAPYMHNGGLSTLRDVIEHYNRGGRPFINKDTLMKRLNLSENEKLDLIEFLKSLTDWEFLKNKIYKEQVVK
jgi:cytochrome c peroxidase